MSFDFKKFEKNIPKFSALLKTEMQTRLFTPIAPDFDVKVRVADLGRGCDVKIYVETTGLAKWMNFHMFSEVRLRNFGRRDAGYNNVLSNSTYWLPISWSWESHVGVGNGVRAFVVYLNDDGDIVEVKT